MGSRRRACSSVFSRTRAAWLSGILTILPLAGRLVTLRLEPTLLHVIVDGKLWGLGLMRAGTNPLQRGQISAAALSSRSVSSAFVKMTKPRFSSGTSITRVT